MSGLSAIDYAGWMRQAGSRARSRPDALNLTDTALAEPTALLSVSLDLAQTARERLMQPVGGDGNPALIALLRDRLQAGAGEILCWPGAMSALRAIFETHLSPGDEVVLERPGYPIFGDLAERFGAAPVYVEAGGGVTVEAIGKVVSPRTRCVALSSPHNPTGRELAVDLLQDLRQALDPRIVLVVDEVMRTLGSYGQTPAAAAAAPGVVTLGSMTKGFGLGTLRCGWSVSTPAFADILRRRRGPPHDISRLTHGAAAAVLAQWDAYAGYSQAVLESSARMANAWLAEMAAAGLAQGDAVTSSLLMFPQVTGVADTLALSEAAWASQGLLVSPGDLFGAPGRLRLGIGEPAETLAPKLAALGEILRRRA